MELVFEVIGAEQFVPGTLCNKTFKQNGGVIGRGEDCEWSLPDDNRHLSKHHAQISYRSGAFYLTDISSNGIQVVDSKVNLPKGEPQLIEHDTVYLLGGFKIQACLVRDPDSSVSDVGRPQPAGSIIPDDVFIGLDPLTTLDRQACGDQEIDDLTALSMTNQEPEQCADYAQIDMENLLVPELVAPPEVHEALQTVPMERQREAFWEGFGEALGVDLQGLDAEACEALAMKVAGLLKQCIGGLQQSLRTRSELKNELRLSLSAVRETSKNPLRSTGDAGEALRHLLQNERPGQLGANQAVAQAFRDLQAHQVALLYACRAAVRATLEHFSPRQLILRFERDGKSLLATSGGRWRAYGRYHQNLCQDDEWSERLLVRDFAQAYEEQVRLISTLYTEHQG